MADKSDQSDEAKKTKKPKPGISLAPLYLAAALAVCYLVLTRMVPAMHTVTEQKPGQDAAPTGWLAVSLDLSDFVRSHSVTTIVAFSFLALAGFALPIIFRPARFLVWFAALAFFLLDVALAAGGYLQMILKLIDEANKVGG